MRHALIALLLMTNTHAVLGSSQPPIPFDAWYSIPYGNSSWSREVACDSTLAVTGAVAPDFAEVYGRSESGWQLQQTLTLPGLQGSIASPKIHENQLLALRNPGTSAALHVFDLVDGLFVLTQSIPVPAGEAWRRLDADGHRLVISVTGVNAGVRVRTFVRDENGSWATDGLWTLVSTGTWGSGFVRMHGDWIVATDASLSYGSANTVGRVYVARRNAEEGTWSLAQTISSPVARFNLRFGQSAAVTDGDLFIGIPGWSDGRGGLRGVVHRHALDRNGLWVFQEVIESPEPKRWENFGSEIWSDGTRLLVAGSPHALAGAVPRVWALNRIPEGGWTRGAALLPMGLIPNQFTDWRRIDSDGTMVVVGDRAQSGSSIGKHFFMIVDRMFDCDADGVGDGLQIDAGDLDCDGDRRPDACQGAPRQAVEACVADCDGDGLPDLEAFAAGAVADCNGNGIPDACDVTSGFAADSDGNGVPDSCQPDCDGDGILDDTAIALGLVPDCNHDGVPDGCPIYESGPPLALTGSWIIYTNGAETGVYYAQRFDVQAGREVLHRIDYRLSVPNCNNSYLPLRICLFRDSPGLDSPFTATPVWYADTYSGLDGTWSNVAVPGIEVGRVGEGFVVVIVRMMSSGCWTMTGSYYYCTASESAGCGSSWWGTVSSTGYPALEGLLENANFGDLSWSFRVYGSSCPQADLNGDGFVNGADLAILLAHWGYAPGAPADLTGDGLVDGADIAVLLSVWGS